MRKFRTWSCRDCFKSSQGRMTTHLKSCAECEELPRSFRFRTLPRRYKEKIYSLTDGLRAVWFPAPILTFSACMQQRKVCSDKQNRENLKPDSNRKTHFISRIRFPKTLPPSFDTGFA